MRTVSPALTSIGGSGSMAVPTWPRRRTPRSHRRRTRSPSGSSCAASGPPRAASSPSSPPTTTDETVNSRLSDSHERVFSPADAVDPVAKGGDRGSAPPRSRSLATERRAIESLPVGGGRVLLVGPAPGRDQGDIGRLGLFENDALAHELGRSARLHSVPPARQVEPVGRAAEEFQAAQLFGAADRRRPAIVGVVGQQVPGEDGQLAGDGDRKSTRLNSSHAT